MYLKTRPQPILCKLWSLTDKPRGLIQMARCLLERLTRSSGRPRQAYQLSVAAGLLFIEARLGRMWKGQNDAASGWLRTFEARMLQLVTVDRSLLATTEPMLRVRRALIAEFE